MAQSGRSRDFNALPPSTQTARALPTHTTRNRTGEATAAQRLPSKLATVEGPIRPHSIVTQRFERRRSGEFFERQVTAEILEALGAVVESSRGGDVVQIRVEVLDGIWARYDSGDYGTGQPGLALYSDIAELPETTVQILDVDLAANPDRPLAESKGPLRIMAVKAATGR